MFSSKYKLLCIAQSEVNYYFSEIIGIKNWPGVLAASIFIASPLLKKNTSNNTILLSHGLP